MEYIYHAYGLNIQSALPCPQLLSGRGQPDVAIAFGTLPDSLPNVKSFGVCFQATNGKLLLVVPDIAKYLISNGDDPACPLDMLLVAYMSLVGSQAGPPCANICAIDVGKEQPLLYPGFPQVKLWADACLKLGKSRNHTGASVSELK